VYGLGDVEGPEKETSGDRVTRRRREKDIRESEYQNIGTPRLGYQGIRVSGHQDITGSGYQEIER